MKRNFCQRLISVLLMLCMLFALTPAMAEVSALHAYCYGFSVSTGADGQPTGFNFKIGAQFGTAPYTLSWSMSGGASMSGSVTGDSKSISLPGNYNSGEYTFSVTAQDAVGAQKTASMKVNYAVDEAGNVSQSILSSVNPQTIKVTNVALNLSSLALKVGDYAQLIHSVEPANAANRSVLWSSSHPSVATVDQTGLIEALGQGTAVITCTAKDGSGVYATCTITVTQRVAGVQLNNTAVTVGVGGTYKLSATVTPEGAANKEVTYTSSNNAVAVVANDGTVTGVSAGVAAITAASKENSAITATCVVTVGTPVETVTVSPKAVELATGSSLTLSAAVAPDNATNKTLSWSSSDTAVATVDQSGRVSVWKAGTATITVRAVDGSGKQDTCTITATGNDVTPPSTTPPSDDTSTPPSTETTTPPPSSGGTTMYVDTVEGGLHLRTAPRQDAGSKLLIPRHAAVTVLTYGSSWSYVCYGGVYGYSMSKFLSASISSDTETTTPPPSTETTTPPPSGSTYLYVVTETGRLNLRTHTSQNAPIIARIDCGELVRVIDFGSIWSKVSYNNKIGYVMSKFLTATAPETTTPPSTDTPPTTDTPPADDLYLYVVTETGRLNLRSNTSQNAPIIARIDRGELVKVLDFGSVWSKVSYNNKVGYVMSSFLSDTAPAPETTTPPSTSDTPPIGDMYLYVSTEKGSLNLRTQTSQNAPIIARIPRGELIRVIDLGSVWSKVSYNNKVGYVMTLFLSDTAPAPETTTPPTTTPPTTDTPPVSDMYLYVSTEKGSLNLRTQTSQNAPIVARIPRGTLIKVLDLGAVWSKASYNNKVGYVMTKFLSDTEPAPETTPPSSDETTRPPESTGNAKYAQVVTEKGSLNMRKSESTSSTLITRIPQNAYVQVLSTGSTWCKVSYGGKTGYVMTQFLSFSELIGSSEGLQPTQIKSSGNMYKEQSSSSAKLAEVAAGDYVYYYSDNGTWAKVLHLGNIGYIKLDCLTLPEGVATVDNIKVYEERSYTTENNSAVLATLNTGDTVKLLHCYGDIWWLVRLSNGIEVYVSALNYQLKISYIKYF